MPRMASISGHEALSTITIFPDRRKPVPTGDRISVRRRETTVRPMTFKRTWRTTDSIKHAAKSPSENNATNKKQKVDRQLDATSSASCTKSKTKPEDNTDVEPVGNDTEGLNLRSHTRNVTSGGSTGVIGIQSSDFGCVSVTRSTRATRKSIADSSMQRDNNIEKLKVVLTEATTSSAVKEWDSRPSVKSSARNKNKSVVSRHSSTGLTEHACSTRDSLSLLQTTHVSTVTMKDTPTLPGMDSHAKVAIAKSNAKTGLSGSRNGTEPSSKFVLTSEENVVTAESSQSSCLASDVRSLAPIDVAAKAGRESIEKRPMLIVRSDLRLAASKSALPVAKPVNASPFTNSQPVSVVVLEETAKSVRALRTSAKKAIGSATSQVMESNSSRCRASQVEESSELCVSNHLVQTSIRASLSLRSSTSRVDSRSELPSAARSVRQNGQSSRRGLHSDSNIANINGSNSQSIPKKASSGRHKTHITAPGKRPLKIAMDSVSAPRLTLDTAMESEAENLTVHSVQDTLLLRDGKKKVGKRTASVAVDAVPIVRSSNKKRKLSNSDVAMVTKSFIAAPLQHRQRQPAASRKTAPKSNKRKHCKRQVCHWATDSEDEDEQADFSEGDIACVTRMTKSQLARERKWRREQLERQREQLHLEMQEAEQRLTKKHVLSHEEITEYLTNLRHVLNRQPL